MQKCFNCKNAVMGSRAQIFPGYQLIPSIHTHGKHPGLMIYELVYVLLLVLITLEFSSLEKNCDAF
uniref:Uncharacterized protein n=1 Tax=Arundo donax TaxID=35708 RepID=A0A0A8YNB7_ARUDO